MQIYTVQTFVHMLTLSTRHTNLWYGMKIAACILWWGLNHTLKCDSQAYEFRSAIIYGGVLIEQNFQPVVWKVCSNNTPPHVIVNLNSQAWIVLCHSKCNYLGDYVKGYYTLSDQGGWGTLVTKLKALIEIVFCIPDHNSNYLHVIVKK